MLRILKVIGAQSKCHYSNYHYVILVFTTCSHHQSQQIVTKRLTYKDIVHIKFTTCVGLFLIYV
jgi:hypothetical protein